MCRILCTRWPLLEISEVMLVVLGIGGLLLTMRLGLCGDGDSDNTLPFTVGDVASALAMSGVDARFELERRLLSVTGGMGDKENGVWWRSGIVGKESEESTANGLGICFE